MKAREVKREKLAKRYAHKREEIAAKVKSGEMDHEEAWIALSKLPRNSNPIRQHNRCKITGRPKGYIRQPYPVPRDGLEGADSRRDEGQLVATTRKREPRMVPASGLSISSSERPEGVEACKGSEGVFRRRRAAETLRETLGRTRSL